MKLKISLYAVTLVVIYYVFGYMLLFQICRERIRFEQSEIIEANTSDTHFFSFLKNDWKKLKINSHEFGYKGKLFDIVQLEVQGDFVRVEAIGDEKEILLLNEFSDLQENSEDDSLPVTIFSVFGTDFFPCTIFKASIYESNGCELSSLLHLPSSQFSQAEIIIPPDFLKG